MVSKQLSCLNQLSSCFSKLTQKNHDAHCASKALFGVKKLLIHCLIYKVHAPLGAGSLYYHARKALSRVFFTSKEENPGSPERFANIPRRSPIVNNFFRVLEKFFSVGSEKGKPVDYPSARLYGSERKVSFNAG